MSKELFKAKPLVIKVDGVMMKCYAPEDVARERKENRYCDEAECIILNNQADLIVSQDKKLKELKERDERLTKELFSNTSQTIGGVVYELIPRGKYRKVVGELKGK